MSGTSDYKHALPDKIAAKQVHWFRHLCSTKLL